jgi:hypothetical protein
MIFPSWIVLFVKRDNEIENSACVHAGLRVDYIWAQGRFVQGGGGESVRHKERSLTQTQNITLTELEFGSNTTNTLP